jgi:hypothetical protein
MIIALVRHFKTEPTETVWLCFGYPKTQLVNCVDEDTSFSVEGLTEQQKLLQQKR